MDFFTSEDYVDLVRFVTRAAAQPFGKGGGQDGTNFRIRSGRGAASFFGGKTRVTNQVHHKFIIILRVTLGRKKNEECLKLVFHRISRANNLISLFFEFPTDLVARFRDSFVTI